VLACLRQEHDFRLVLVAALVCLLATSITAWLYGRMLRQHGGWRLAWLALTGVAAGSGVWSTHFIAMLAFAPSLETGYDLAGTGGSLVLAMVSAAAGFGIAARSPKGAGLALGGAVVGAGVAMMHYVGMAAFRPRGVVIWDYGYVAASLAIGLAFAVAAMYAAGGEPNRRRGAAMALLLTVAICGLHFTAMAAATILPDPWVPVPAQLAARPVLAVMIFAVALLILAAAALVAFVEAGLRAAAVDKLRIATNAMPAALAVYDAHDRLVVWNRTYEQLRPHYPKLLKPGILFDDIARADGFEEVWIANRKRERRQGKSLESKFDGDVWVRIDNVRTADGGLITVGVDVSELKSQAETLARALEQAEAANRAKAEFLANMSHEIRTPLNGVAGIADVLARTRLSAHQRDLLGIIRSSAQSVDDMLGQVLDLSRLDSDKVGAVRNVFHLADVIRTVAKARAPDAERAGLELRIEIASELESRVFGDAERIDQILDVLISNAIKFTEAGVVLVRGSALGSDLFRLEIEDTGIGFDAALKERMFERFAQADGSMTRRRGGAGVGLAIARRHADLLGASLDCRSEPGKGSTFFLDVTLESAEAVRAALPSGPAANIANDPAAPLALVVDDNATNRKLLELVLRQLGAEWRSVENGEQAIGAWEEHAFDVILMDIQMPVMDGLSATREIRRREQATGRARTPVIMVSANGTPEHRTEGFLAGADGYLAKPVDLSALAQLLDEALAAGADEPDQGAPAAARSTG
jgi:NO-binding membrane sensor protein with MHYT domain/CheY-like chemotaxis protein